MDIFQIGANSRYFMTLVLRIWKMQYAFVGRLKIWQKDDNVRNLLCRRDCSALYKISRSIIPKLHWSGLEGLSVI